MATIARQRPSRRGQTLDAAHAGYADPQYFDPNDPFYSHATVAKRAPACRGARVRSPLSPAAPNLFVSRAMSTAITKRSLYRLRLHRALTASRIRAEAELMGWRTIRSSAPTVSRRLKSRASSGWQATSVVGAKGGAAAPAATTPQSDSPWLITDADHPSKVGEYGSGPLSIRERWEPTTIYRRASTSLMWATPMKAASCRRAADQRSDIGP